MPQVRTTLTKEGKRASPEPRSEPPDDHVAGAAGLEQQAQERAASARGRGSAGSLVKIAVERPGGEREEHHHREAEGHAELERAQQLCVGLVEAAGPDEVGDLDLRAEGEGEGPDDGEDDQVERVGARGQGHVAEGDDDADEDELLQLERHRLHHRRAGRSGGWARGRGRRSASERPRAPIGCGAEGGRPPPRRGAPSSCATMVDQATPLTPSRGRPKLPMVRRWLSEMLAAFTKIAASMLKRVSPRALRMAA